MPNRKHFIPANAVFSHICAPGRFRLAFESKVAEVAAAQTRLSALIQRLAFAKGRVEAIQGVITLAPTAALQLDWHMSGKEMTTEFFFFFSFQA